MRWLFDLLYGSVPAAFESRFGLEESVRRLSAATQRFTFLATKQVAVGHVSRNRVSLRRAIPFFGNSFAPLFFGEFHEDGGRTVLSGRFTIRRFTKAFMTLWLGFCLLWTVVTVVLAVMATMHAPYVWLFPLFGVATLGVGLTMVSFSKWLSRSDIPWLSGVIREALSN